MSNDAQLLIDVTRLIWRRWVGKRPTGIDRVCLAYLEHFAHRAQAVVQAPSFRRILSREASHALINLLLDDAVNFRPHFVARMTRHLSSALLPLPGNGRPYLNVGHTGLDKPGYADWARRAGVRSIYMVHDLIPITHPEYCRAGEAEKHRRRMRTVLESGSGIISNSQATLDALNSFATSEGLPTLPQISSWLGGAQLKPLADAAPSPAKPYFVMLGTIEGRKNHLLILNVWAELIREFGTSAPRLRIIGQRGWEADQVFAMLDRNEMLRDHVVEINDCSDKDLAFHLTYARALLFPSMVEGYGLPLIEALDAGVPVIASDIPIFREIAGDIPDYASPLDGLLWKERISEYTSWESPARAAQQRRLANYPMPNWKMHFDLVESWLEKLCCLPP